MGSNHVFNDTHSPHPAAIPHYSAVNPLSHPFNHPHQGPKFETVKQTTLPTMKRSNILSLLAIPALLFAAGCGQIKQQVTTQLFQAFVTDEFTIPVEIPPITIAPAQYNNIAVGAQAIDLDAIIRDRTDGAFGLDDVKGIYLEGLSATVDNADAVSNLANFESVTIELTSGAQAQPVRLTSTTIPDVYASEVQFDVDPSVNLKPYFQSTAANYSVSGAVRRPTAKTLSGKIRIRFDVQ